MNKNKILLIDDELNLNETISEFLTYENYIVKTAANGQEALDILDYWTPDLILCDITMPVMDGNTFHEIVRENKSLNVIPFIFITAKKEYNLKKKCIIDGADEFITKPFKFKELSQIIETKINRFKKIKEAANTILSGEKNQFLHEINTSLNGILGFTNLLIEDESNLDKEEISTFYDAIKISGEQLNRTIQNLTLFQNISNNDIDFNDDSHAEILKMFTEAKENIAMFHENQQKRISFDIRPSKIAMNEKHLYFILFELIDNALKFSPKDKKIAVHGTKYNDEFYELNIIDSGIGFTDKEIKKIDAAQQFNPAEKERQGLGLGLYLSKTIVQKSNGVFSIVSEKNQGTNIKMFLPLKTELF